MGCDGPLGAPPVGEFDVNLPPVGLGGRTYEGLVARALEDVPRVRQAHGRNSDPVCHSFERLASKDVEDSAAQPVLCDGRR